MEQSEKNRQCTGKCRDIEVWFCDGSEEPRTFRLYESMYEQMKDEFYGTSKNDTMRFIIGYEKYTLTPSDDAYMWNGGVQKISPNKSFINLRNVTHISVLPNGRDSDVRR